MNNRGTRGALLQLAWISSLALLSACNGGLATDAGASTNDGENRSLAKPGLCTPDCNGKACGDDGCGGSCGSCAGAELCNGLGTCYDPNQCTPDCAGKECGDDGCGGGCGSCTAPATCGGAGVRNRCGDGTATTGLFLDGFFPIGSFIIYPPQTAMHVARGINTAVGIPDTSGEYTDRQWDDAMVAAGLKVIRRPIGNLVTDAAKPHLLAWAHPDEPDYCDHCSAPWIDYPLMQSIEADYATWKAAAPDMPVYINFGGSDILDGSPYSCNGPGDQSGPETDLDCYPRLIAAADWIVNDIYPIDGWLSDEAWRHDITDVGQVLDKLRGKPFKIDPTWSTKWTDKPLMGFVEASFFDDSTGGTRAATRHEVRAMIWDLIIHGARGIFYFPLVVNPGFMWDDMPAGVEAEVTLQDGIITQLAPVLQDVINPTTLSATMSSAQLEAGWRDTPSGKYFFVLNTRKAPVTGATIRLSGTGSATSAAAFGESRNEPITGGAITDDFGAYGLHIYLVN